MAESKKFVASALLKFEIKLELIMKAIVEATAIPVIIKYRPGWDMKTFNAVRIDQIKEQVSFTTLALSGHAREDKYRPFAEYETIRRVKKHVNIPLIVDSDISDKETATFVLDYTIADEIMIARRPFRCRWIFSELNKQLFGIQYASTITNDYKRSVEISHVEAVQNSHAATTDHQVVSTNNRSHFVCKVINWYLLHMSIQSNVRQNKLSCKTPSDQLLLFKDALLAGNGTKLAASQF